MTLEADTVEDFSEVSVSGFVIKKMGITSFSSSLTVGDPAKIRDKAFAW